MPVAFVIADLMKNLSVGSSNASRLYIGMPFDDRAEIRPDDIVVSTLRKQGRRYCQCFTEARFATNFRLFGIRNDAKQMHDGQRKR